jgi:hypothetical protein
MSSDSKLHAHTAHARATKSALHPLPSIMALATTLLAWQILSARDPSLVQAYEKRFCIFSHTWRILSSLPANSIVQLASLRQAFPKFQASANLFSHQAQVRYLFLFSPNNQASTSAAEAMPAALQQPLCHIHSFCIS